MRTTREEIAQLYGTLEVRTTTDGATFTLAPFDLMTCDDDGRITSMRAFWSDADMAVS